MKNIKIFSALIFLASLVAGCADFMDKLPENQVDVDNVDYTKVENMYQPVSGIYARMRTIANWTGYGFYAVRTGDVDKGATPTDQIELTYCKNFEYDKVRNYSLLNETWTTLYNIIFNANAALDALDEYEKNITRSEDQNRYKEYVAEVRVLRAIAYYHICLLWENAPLINDNDEVVINKNTWDEKVDFIVSELTAAADALPAIRPNEWADRKGAVTKLTALGYLAKIQMYANNWDAVYTATEAIIATNKMSLYEDFYELFKVPGKLCDESLFELQFTDFGNGSGESIFTEWFKFQGPRGNANPKPVYGWAFMAPTQELIDFFKRRGETVRYNTTFIFADEVTLSGDTIAPNLPGEPFCYSGKAYTPKNQTAEGRTMYGEGNNVRMLRYADILLMNAEARVRKGQNGDAPFNEVRRRAAMPELTNVTIDQILDERHAELTLEWGDRFYDLVRTDKAASVLPNFVKGESEFYPIPLDQIDLNSNLK